MSREQAVLYLQMTGRAPDLVSWAMGFSIEDIRRCAGQQRLYAENQTRARAKALRAEADMLDKVAAKQDTLAAVEESFLAVV